MNSNTQLNGATKPQIAIEDVEDRETCVACLAKCRCEHLGRDAIELRVELNSGHELAGTCNLEVHVAQGILGAKNVGEGNVALLAVNLFGHETHGNTGDGGAERHTGVQQRQGRCTAEPIEVEPFEPRASET